MQDPNDAELIANQLQSPTAAPLATAFDAAKGGLSLAAAAEEHFSRSLLAEASSTSTCSSFEEDWRSEARSNSSLGPTSRRPSLLSDSGKPSRRSSLVADGSSCPASPQVRGSEAAATAAHSGTQLPGMFNGQKRTWQSCDACMQAAVCVLVNKHACCTMQGGHHALLILAACHNPVLSHSNTALWCVILQQQADDDVWWARKWSWGSHHDQNQRLHMEDRMSHENLSCHPLFQQYKRAGFFAVYDGHSGHQAAEYLSLYLKSYVLSAPQLATAPGAALQQAVERAEHEIVTQFAETRCNAGSTLLAMLLLDDRLYIANVGDCRAVLGRGTDACQLTHDHKPHCVLEKQRIAAMDPSADITDDGYMYGELAVARAIGSQHIKLDPSKKAFIYQPEVFEVQLSKEDDFVVLATDGLWDKVENQEAITTARRSLALHNGGVIQHKKAEMCAKALVERAVRRNSQDNISVIVVCFHDRTISLPKTNSMLFRKTNLDSPRASTPNSTLCTPAETPAETPRTGSPRSSLSLSAPTPTLPPIHSC